MAAREETYEKDILEEIHVEHVNQSYVTMKVGNSPNAKIVTSASPDDLRMQALTHLTEINVNFKGMGIKPVTLYRMHQLTGTSGKTILEIMDKVVHQAVSYFRDMLYSSESEVADYLLTQTMIASMDRLLLECGEDLKTSASFGRSHNKNNPNIYTTRIRLNKDQDEVVMFLKWYLDFSFVPDTKMENCMRWQNAFVSPKCFTHHCDRNHRLINLASDRVSDESQVSWTTKDENDPWNKMIMWEKTTQGVKSRIANYDMHSPEDYPVSRRREIPKVSQPLRVQMPGDENDYTDFFEGNPGQWFATKNCRFQRIANNRISEIFTKRSQTPILSPTGPTAYVVKNPSNPTTSGFRSSLGHGGREERSQSREPELPPYVNWERTHSNPTQNPPYIPPMFKRPPPSHGAEGGNINSGDGREDRTGPPPRQINTIQIEENQNLIEFVLDSDEEEEMIQEKFEQGRH